MPSDPDRQAVRSFGQRLLGASLLDADTYEEIEADARAGGQAFAVVLASGLATGIGAIANSGWAGIFWHTLAAVLLWGVWAYLSYIIGTRWLPGSETESSPGELMRTIGFSSAPGLIRIGMLIGPLALPIFVIGTLWMFVAMVVALRQALDYAGTGRALAVCAIGFPVYALGLALQFLALGPWPV